MRKWPCSEHAYYIEAIKAVSTISVLIWKANEWHKHPMHFWRFLCGYAHRRNIWSAQFFVPFSSLFFSLSLLCIICCYCNSCQLQTLCEWAKRAYALKTEQPIVHAPKKAYLVLFLFLFFVFKITIFIGIICLFLFLQ